MVPHAGVEPALLAELDFESSASTNSANGASSTVLCKARPRRADYTDSLSSVNRKMSERSDLCTRIDEQLNTRRIYRPAKARYCSTAKAGTA